MKLKLAFAGTPPIAQALLDYLLKHQAQIQVVYTQPDKPAGRGQKLTPSPVKTLAEAHQIPVLQPKSLKTETAAETLRSFEPDLLIVVAYGLILPKAILAVPKYGCINVHVSLLPRWRGAAPIQRAIEAGDSISGITLMQMDEGLDTGAILKQVSCELDPKETSQTLQDKLIPVAQQALGDLLEQLDKTGKLVSIPQPETGVTYAHKIEKSEAELDWQLPATRLERKIRAFTPWPIAYAALGPNKTLVRIHAAEVSHHVGAVSAKPGDLLTIDAKGITLAAGEGTSLTLTEIQLPGKTKQPVQSLIHGRTLQNLFGL